MGEIRIIAGRYRNRKLLVRNHDGLRPTGNRIKETVFNWLSRDIVDSTCIDLFSGSGALAFEAASRAAKKVFAIELDAKNSEVLTAAKQTFNCENITIVRDNALHWLDRYQGEIDIAFVDPPFGKNLHSDTLKALARHSGVSTHTKIYVEAASTQGFDIPPGWSWLSHKVTGEVQYGLLSQLNDN